MPNKAGSPVFEVTFADGLTARTVPGAQVGFLLDNSEFRGVELDVGWRRGEIVAVSLAATPGGPSPQSSARDGGA